jgi:hypothetical protein
MILDHLTFYRLKHIDDRGTARAEFAISYREDGRAGGPEGSGGSAAIISLHALLGVSGLSPQLHAFGDAIEPLKCLLLVPTIEKTLAGVFPSPEAFERRLLRLGLRRAI